MIVRRVARRMLAAVSSVLLAFAWIIGILPGSGRSRIIPGKSGGCRDPKGWRLNDVSRLLPTARTAVRSDSGPALLVFQPGTQRSAGVAFLWNRDRAWIPVARGGARDGQNHASLPVA